MADEYAELLGRYDERPFSVTVRASPSFDKLYRRDQPKEQLDVGIWEAVARLKNDWRRYAESYERNWR
jgi:hypothetical protein